ncbi:hypothetical protein KM043_004656 [Ampulex compressa]|nr:hypothetical protein KM043_004656 [Ampulex compressa]
MGNCVKPIDPLAAAIPRSSGIDASAIKESSLPIIFVIGGPGAGKKTQCYKVAKKYGFLSIVSGDLLRDEIATHSQRGVILARLMSESKLVPPDVLLELIKTKMLNALGATKGFVLSGFPREKEQAKIFDRQIRPPDLVLYLSVENALLRERMMSRMVTSTERWESSTEHMKKRIKDFRRKTGPILRHYKKLLMLIDGDQDVPEVFEDVCKAISDTLRNMPATTMADT